MQVGIPDTASLSPLTPPSHATHLAKGQPAPSAVGTLFASAAFTPVSALYRSQDEAAPVGSGQSPSLLLPEQPRLSFTLPEPDSQIKPAAANPTPPESPSPTAGSPPPPPPSPSQPGEPFVPDLDVSAYSTDYAQLRDWYEALQQELSVAQGDLESLKRDLDMIRPNGTTPCTKSSDPPLHNGRLRPLSYTTSSGPCPPSCPLPLGSAASSPRHPRSPTPCAVRCRPRLSYRRLAPHGSWPSCPSSLPLQSSPRPRCLTLKTSLACSGRLWLRPAP